MKLKLINLNTLFETTSAEKFINKELENLLNRLNYFTNINKFINEKTI